MSKLLADLKTSFTKIAEDFGAKISEDSDGLLVATNGPSHKVSFQAETTGEGIVCVLRTEGFKLPLPTPVKDQASFAKAETFMRDYGLRPLTSDLSLGRLSVLQRPSGRKRNISIQGGGISLRMKDHTYEMIFMMHPKLKVLQPLFAFFTSEGLKNVLFTPGPTGTYEAIKPYDGDPDKLFEITSGPATAEFTLVDHAINALIPISGKLESSSANLEWPFELHLHKLRDVGYLYVLGPFTFEEFTRRMDSIEENHVARGGAESSRWTEIEVENHDLIFREIHVGITIAGRCAIVVGRSLAFHFSRVREEAFALASDIRPLEGR